MADQNISLQISLCVKIIIHIIDYLCAYQSEGLGFVDFFPNMAPIQIKAGSLLRYVVAHLDKIECLPTV